MKLQVEITRNCAGEVEHLGEKKIIETKFSFLSQKKEERDAFEREFKATMHYHVMHFLSGGTEGILRGFGSKEKSMTYSDNGCRAIFRYCLRKGEHEEEFIVNATIINDQDK